MPTTLGICQIPVLGEVRHLDPWLEAMAEHNAPCLWLLPELFLGGFSLEDTAARLAEAREASERIQHFVDASSHALAASLLAENPDNAPGNAFFLFRPSQPPLRVYDKLHLFPASAEIDHLSPGRPLFSKADFAGLRLGACVCYDLRFPEVFRIQSEFGTEHGVDLFLVCAQWPEQRMEHFRLLLRARAVENQCHVLAVNGCGRSERNRLGGGSRLVAPSGEVLAACGEEPTLMTVSLRQDEVARASELFDSRVSPVLGTVPRAPRD